MLYASKSKTVIISLIFVFKRKCVQKKKLLKMCHRFSFPQSRQWMGTHEYLPLHKNLCVFVERARILYKYVGEFCQKNTERCLYNKKVCTPLSILLSFNDTLII